MTEQNTLNILKQALLLEQKGKSFYASTAAQATDEDVKMFFAGMAQEEDRHIAILANQFKSYQETGAFLPDSFEADASSRVADAVLSESLVSRISAAGFEAAAISAAMAMEANAIELYSGRAKTAEDPEEKTLYAWLAEWEKGHLEALADLDRKLTESIWNDNNFWPF